MAQEGYASEFMKTPWQSERTSFMLMDFEGLGGRLGLLLIIALAAMVGLVATRTSAQSSSTSHVPQGFGGQQSPGFPGPQQQPLPTPEINPQPSLSPKQKQELLKS